MIEAGEIYASINQKDGMVSFLEAAADQYSSVAMAGPRPPPWHDTRSLIVCSYVVYQ